jgi:hypothetical protein
LDEVIEEINDGCGTEIEKEGMVEYGKDWGNDE